MNCRDYMRITGTFLTLALGIIATHPVLAQDLKPVSTALASQISTAGRKRVAVVDFTDLEGNATKLGRYLAEELSVILVSDAKDNFEVIDRTHLKAILQEHRLSAKGLIDPQTARKLGEIVGADTLLTGTITPFGDTVRMSIKAIDPGSAKLVAATTADIPKTPAIASLLGENLTTPTSSAADLGIANAVSNSRVKAGGTIIVESQSFVFELDNCHRLGDLLTCSGSVNNQLSERRTLDFSCCSPGFPQAIDNDHKQYDAAVVLGARGQRQELESDLPVSFTLSVPNFSPRATSVSFVLSCSTYGGTQARVDFKITIRNVPISQK